MKREEILSKEEIDALMNVFSKKPRTPLPPVDGGIIYNHFRVEKNWEELKKQLEKITGLFSRLLVSSLSELLRHDVVLNTFVIEPPVAYESFLASVNNPSCIGVLTSPGITALLELDLNLAYTIVDIMLGGKGDNYLEVVRALTDLELEVMKKPVERILKNLDKVLNLELQLEDIFTYPSQIRINSPYEVVIPLVFDVMFEEATTNSPTAYAVGSMPSKNIRKITFCIPRIALESQFSNQNTVSIDDKKKDKYCETIKKGAFSSLPLRLQAIFPKTEITIGRLMEMKVGDTIDLNMQPDADVIEVELLVEGCPKFIGKLGAIGRYKALEITLPK